MPLPGEDAYGLDSYFDAPEMPSVGRGERGYSPYRCLDCDVRNMGERAALEHHRVSRHHRIANRCGLVMRWSCCPDVSEPDTEERER